MPYCQLLNMIEGMYPGGYQGLTGCLCIFMKSRLNEISHPQKFNLKISLNIKKTENTESADAIFITSDDKIIKIINSDTYLCRVPVYNPVFWVMELQNGRN